MSEPTNPCDVPIPIGVCGSQYQWRPCGNPTPCQRHTLPVAPKPSLSEPTKEHIEKARVAMQASFDTTFASASESGRGWPEDAYLLPIAELLAAETAPLHEKIASLEQQLAALAPPAQTQQGLSEDDLKVRREALEAARQAALEGGCDCHFAPCPHDEAGKVIAFRIQQMIDNPPLNLEKQPSPAAAPAQLSEAIDRFDMLVEDYAAHSPRLSAATKADRKAVNLLRAALAGQPAPTEGPLSPLSTLAAMAPVVRRAVGFFDRAVLVLSAPGAYSAAQTADSSRDCESSLRQLRPMLRTLEAYALTSREPAPTDDQKALRAAAMEEAARLADSFADAGTAVAIEHVFAAATAGRIADAIRALAGSPAQKGQLTKKGGG